MEKLPLRLTEARKSKKLTQNDVANALHMTQSNISAYEKGIRNPPIEILVELARYYGVSVDYLLGISLTDYPDKKNERPLARLARIPQPDSQHPVTLDAFIRLANSMAAYVAIGAPAGNAPVNTAGDVVHAAASLLDAAAADSLAEVIDAANALAVAGLSATDTVREFADRNYEE